MDNSNNLSGERIRCKREELNMTQEKVAQKCSVSLNTIKNWESGTHFPGKNDLLALSKALHSTPNYLIGFDDNNQFVLEDTTAEERLVMSLLHKLLHPELDGSDN